MRSKLPWFLLAASVALNLFFVAGVFYPQVMGQRDASVRSDPVAAAAEAFSLDDRQVQALRDLRARIAERRDARNDARQSFRAVIIDALRTPAFDRAALAQALSERRAVAGDTIVDMTEDMHGFLAGLAREQKTAMLERAEEDRAFLRRLLFPRRPDR